MPERPGPRRPLAQEHGGPALIAHGAGNSADLARAALAEMADFLEVDLWVHGNRLEARHERAAYPIPLLVEKWYLRRPPRRPFSLDELVATVAPRAGIFFDLKNGGVDVARMVREAMDAASEPPRVAASAQQWELLRALRRACPEIECFYSVDVMAKLQLFRSVADRDLVPTGISCRHTLLSQGLVEELHMRGLSVVAWTVDDVDRAKELALWGVDGITTHHVALLRTAIESLQPAP